MNKKLFILLVLILNSVQTELAMEPSTRQKHWLGEELYVAARDGKIDEVKSLLATKANVNRTCNFVQSTALTEAARHGHQEICELLIQAGATINHLNIWGDTPLIWAARENRPETCQLLIKAGANINHCNKNCDTALMCAASKGNKRACDILIKAMLDATENDSQKQICTFLHCLNHRYDRGSCNALRNVFQPELCEQKRKKAEENLHKVHMEILKIDTNCIVPSIIRECLIEKHFPNESNRTDQ
jgi:uncharacterized protein